MVEEVTSLTLAFLGVAPECAGGADAIQSSPKTSRQTFTPGGHEEIHEAFSLRLVSLGGV